MKFNTSVDYSQDISANIQTEMGENNSHFLQKELK